ncbi:Cell division protein FtsK [Fructilactobacillus florum 8D]|uniref:Cell division protein FtsK n=1 Tax=Fructilactobacillus florum 8D TaxID=1221538 RepID=W9EKC3_9LACO|nr:DNA translocase FtsK [Fructilactobacillus florum]EKK20669.1 Cell division protein FtsK [Fructilactobacillus florum 2F]ETO40134.1 Cell division protein FtsK [Fructilactobacillus florum 8D]
MKHYDGPAFFRKYFDGKIPFQKPTESTGHATSAFQSRRSPVPTTKPSSSFLKSTVAVPQNDLVQQTAAFQPHNHAGKRHYQGIKTTLSPRYQRAIQALTNDANLIWLTTEVSVTSKDQSGNHLKWSKLPTTVSEKKPKLPADLHENKNENTVDNSSKSTPAPTRRGLGHSLQEIFQDEDLGAEKLALFSERTPTSKQDAVMPTAEASKKAALPPRTIDSNEISKPAKNPQAVVSQAGKLPSLKLLNPPVELPEDEQDDWILQQAEVLDRTLEAFHVSGKVVSWTNGPTVTEFQVKLALGVKVNKITNLNDDLKLALAAKDIRIEAPIPGKSTVGIEIPNPQPRPVMLSEVLQASAFQTEQAPNQIALGVSIAGNPVASDLTSMPHALIAGATGSGKSVFINSMLLSLLYHATPQDLRMLLIDPKAVELAPYEGIPHLLTPVISDPQEAAAALKWVTEEMDQRYERLRAAGVRNLEQYNRQVKSTGHAADQLPTILVVIDELADLMMVAAGEVQDYIVRITQKARAAGIHLVIATQRPSVDVVTGTIKNNIPTRIAFMVASQIDSRTIIDQAGAERLLGRGDLLYLGNGASKPERLQGAFVTNAEVEKVTAAVRAEGPVHYEFDPRSLVKQADQATAHDELWSECLRYLADEKTVSTSKLQRVFSIGYNRAASLIDDLEQHQLISEQRGAKPRDVYLTPEKLQQLNN